MRRLLGLFLLGMVTGTGPAQAQFETGGGPTGDFRTDDRPITTPTLRAPDGIGARPSDEILRSLDRDLGRSTLDREQLAEPRRDAPKAPSPGEDLGKRPAVPEVRRK